jgi:hypothetical protein
MRGLAVIAVLLLAACGETPIENKAGPAAAAPSPGQWELATEVTRFRKADQGAPRINTPAGTRTTENVCVGPGAELPSAIFSGPHFTCTYPAYYVRGGRINVTLHCSRPGLQGVVPMTVNGTFQADSIEYSRNLRTALASDGDVEIDTRVTGRRTGACTPQAPAGGAHKGG